MRPSPPSVETRDSLQPGQVSTPLSFHRYHVFTADRRRQGRQGETRLPSMVSLLVASAAESVSLAHSLHCRSRKAKCDLGDLDAPVSPRHECMAVTQLTLTSLVRATLFTM
jgi:hypothetical protein